MRRKPVQGNVENVGEIDLDNVLDQALSLANSI